ncbi:hypothetical protein IC582_013369 [Cucumis melo]
MSIEKHRSLIALMYHLQLFCPRKIPAAPLFVIRTFNVVDINHLGDVWFPLHRTR